MNGFHALTHLVSIPKSRSPFDKALLSVAEGLRANGFHALQLRFLGSMIVQLVTYVIQLIEIRQPH